MNPNNDRIAVLILKHLQESLTITDQAELDKWLLQSQEHRQLYDRLTNDKELNEELSRYHRTRTSTWNKMIAANPELQQEARIVHIDQKNRLRPIVAAAIIILLLSAGTYMLFRRTAGKELVQTPAGNKHMQADVLPGSNKATLMLADGSAIVLADAKDGALAPQGSTSLVKRNGQLIYQLATAQAQPAGEMYNKLVTPRKGQYRLVLPDGSKVWLNASSAIRYPVAFAGNERRVELTGEGYFEVTKNPSQPFKVSIKGTAGKESEIEVLGTHFNIMAYADEPALAATLLEGSVKLTKGNTQEILKEGQQALLTDRIRIIKPYNDINGIVAWTKGYFEFRSTDLHVIMRQIARWYDVEIIYKDNINEGFNGALPRDKPLSKVLEVLSLTGRVHFTIEGNKVTVSK